MTPTAPLRSGRTPPLDSRRARRPAARRLPGRSAAAARSPARTTSAARWSSRSPAEPGTLLPPLVGLSISDRQVTDLLYDRLAEIGDDLNTVGDKGFKPQLAERWEWAPDSLSIVFHLDPRARWHDGVPVRASDVRYSFALIKDPALGSPAAAAHHQHRFGLGARLAHRGGVLQAAHARAVLRSRLPGRRSCRSTSSATPRRRSSRRRRSRDAASGPAGSASRSGSQASGSSSSPTRRTIAAAPKLDRIVFSPTPGLQQRRHPVLRRRRRLLRAAAVGAPRAASRRTPRGAPFRIPRCSTPISRSTSSTRSSRASRIRSSATAPCGARSRWRSIAARCCATCSTQLGVPLVRSVPARASTSPTPRCRSSRTTRSQARALLDSAGWTARAGRRALEERPPARVRDHDARHRVRRASSTPCCCRTRSRRVGAAVTVDKVDFARLHGEARATAASTPIIELYATDPSPSGLQADVDAPPASARTDRTTRRTATSRWTRCSTARRRRSIPRARGRTRAARSRSIIEDAPGIWLYEPPTVAGMHKRIRTTAMRADGYWSGMADWWIPAAERIGAGSHRAPAHAVARAALSSPAACCRRRSSSSSSRRSPSCCSTSRPATRSPSRSTDPGVTEEVRAAMARALGLDRPDRRAVRALARERGARRPRILVLVPAPGARRARRRAAAHAAARRARVRCSASRSASSSRVLQAERPGGARDRWLGRVLARCSTPCPTSGSRSSCCCSSRTGCRSSRRAGSSIR